MELSELVGKNVCVFDLETKSPIGGEVGWKDYDKMGISVGVFFCFQKMDYVVCMDDNLDELVQRINGAEIVAGFNIDKFDIPLLRAVSKGALKESLPSYDLLAESRIAADEGQFAKGMKLDDHLKHTFGEDQMKTAHGSEAPLFYQRGELGKLVSYCIADVKREAKLFHHVWKGNPVKSAYHGWRHLKDPRRLLPSPAPVAETTA